MSRNKPKNAPKSPPAPSRDLEPPELEGFAKAWATWLQPVLAALILLAVLAGGYYVVKQKLLPSYLIGTIAACALLVVPILSVVQQTLEDPTASTRRKLWVWALMLLVALAAYAPVIWLSLPASNAFEATLSQSEEGLDVGVGQSGSREWVAELTAKLDESLGAFQAEYGLRVDTEDGRSLMRGRFERKLGLRRDTGAKEFYNIDQDVHRFALDLSNSASIRLYRAGSGLEEVHVRLREQLASWCFLFVIVVPLLLLAAFADATERELGRVPFYSSRMAFMLWFGYLFANTTMPHDFAGPLLVSAAVALIAALGVASVLPRLIKPILHRFRR